MKIHEYQARELLTKHGVPVPDGVVIDTADQAAEAFQQLAPLAGGRAVVKAQVHAGGRGKAGGVKLVDSADKARDAAAGMLSKPLVTAQTGPAGVPVRKILLTAAVDIAHEYYAAVAVDRLAGGPVLIASAEGGMDIEQVAREKPDAIIRQPIDPTAGLQAYQGRNVATRLGLTGRNVAAAGSLLSRLARLFLDTDASLVEINPLVLTKPTDDAPDGTVLALDAKMTFDDNAIFRHKDLAALADPADDEPAEARARKVGLSYVKLDGSIGCLVNGAGLAMATMDLIKLHGYEPANFLDVGGSADEPAVTEGLRIILSDPNVRGVLVNIFGGIMKCDVIARAIVNAAKQVGFTVPLVVRLEGTNVAEARKILESARGEIPTLQTATDLTDAARTITAAVAAA